MWKAVSAAGVPAPVACNYRFVPALPLAKELIDAGKLGEIRHFRALPALAAADSQQPAKPESSGSGHPEPARGPESPEGAADAGQAQKAEAIAILSNDEGSHLTHMVEETGLEPLASTGAPIARRPPSVAAPTLPL